MKTLWRVLVIVGIAVLIGGFVWALVERTTADTAAMGAPPNRGELVEGGEPGAAFAGERPEGRGHEGGPGGAGGEILGHFAQMALVITLVASGAWFVKRVSRLRRRRPVLDPAPAGP